MLEVIKFEYHFDMKGCEKATHISRKGGYVTYLKRCIS